MLPRFTRKVFHDLLIWMVGLGLSVGLIFPFFVLLLGVPAEQALSPKFFVATLLAGFAVGWINFGLGLWVIRPRLRELSERMENVEQLLQEATYTGDWAGCDPETCSVSVDSDDEIGDAGRAFNRLVTAMSQSREVVAAVSRFSETLSSQLEYTILTRQALDLLLQYSRAEAGAILVETQGELNSAASMGYKDTRRIADSDLVRHVLRTGECRSMKLADDLVVDGVVTDFHPRHTVVFPVEYNHQVFGCAVLSTSQTFSAETEGLLNLFRQGLGLALHNALAHERLQHIAAIDPLCGYYNRRFGLARLHEEFSRAVRGDTELGVMIFDIDHFKSINDTYGHLVGDRVIAQVTQVARKIFREGDIPVRYGGEEFCIILPGAAVKDVRTIAERVRRAVEELETRDGEQMIRVTVSLGLASYPESPVGSEEELFEKADQALYRAKRSGRNQVMIAP